jgi:hypothetical protein
MRTLGTVEGLPQERFQRKESTLGFLRNMLEPIVVKAYFMLLVVLQGLVLATL